MVSPRCENHQNEAQVKIAQQLLLSVYKQPLDVKAHPKTILKQLAPIIFPLCFLSAPHRTWYEKVCTGFFLKLQTIVSIKSITVASLYKTKKSSQESLLRSWNQRMFGLWHLRFQKKSVFCWYLLGTFPVLPKLQSLLYSDFQFNAHLSH